MHQLQACARGHFRCHIATCVFVCILDTLAAIKFVLGELPPLGEHASVSRHGSYLVSSFEATETQPSEHCIPTILGDNLHPQMHIFLPLSVFLRSISSKCVGSIPRIWSCPGCTCRLVGTVTRTNIVGWNLG